MLRDASQRGRVVEACVLASRCDAPQHEGARAAFWPNEVPPSGRPREGHPATLASRGPRRGDPGSPAVVMGPGSPLAVARVGRDDNRFSLEHQPAAVGNNWRLGVPVSGLFFTGNGATPTCRAVSARGDSDHALGCVGPRRAGSTTYDNQPAGAFRPTKPSGKTAVTIRPGAPQIPISFGGPA